jgi:two-component system chemotaxis response regulator CheB
VLVVDDAVVVRRLVTDVLAADPEIEVAGAAANGRIALAKLGQLAPDLVVLDVEMPELDGLGTLRELRKTWPRLPVVMFSTLTERGAAVTLEALALGASDYVTKPANVGSVVAAQQRVREELVPRIKALCRRGAAAGLAPGAPPAAPARPPAPRPAGPAAGPVSIDVVAIGVSTGGPNALAAVVPALAASLPVPVVIVQHMPPVFTRLLAERLTAGGGMPVQEGALGVPLQPGHAYLAPGDWHMVVRRAGGVPVLGLHQGPPENSCRPAVDVLFRSVVETYGGRALGVILTGMGRDGLRGVEALREAGGLVFAQDEATSVVWGMPGFVVEAGLADRVLPLDRVAGEILAAVAARRPARGAA